MTASDAVNQRYGRSTLLVASARLEGEGRVWTMRQERRTQAYTNRWDEMAVAKA